MQAIVAIGGGDVADLETLPIDRHVVRLTGKKRPRALLLPTANGDAASNCKVFKTVYGNRLHCRTEVLRLVSRRPPAQEIARQILSADLVYVSGGCTLKMLRLWRRLGVDQLLQRAWRQGVVLSGISAGAVCWFRYAHSDSMSLYNRDDWSFIRVRGLGLINAVACPHYDGRNRDKRFRGLIRKRGGLGIALDNQCALAVVDDTYRVLSATETANAYRVFKQEGEVITEVIERRSAWSPLSDLLTHVPGGYAGSRCGRETKEKNWPQKSS